MLKTVHLDELTKKELSPENKPYVKVEITVTRVNSDESFTQSSGVRATRVLGSYEGDYQGLDPINSILPKLGFETADDLGENPVDGGSGPEEEIPADTP